MRYRILFVFVIVLALWGILLTRAAFLQIIPNARLAHLKQRQFLTKLTIPARRGVILDRSGKELAASVAAWSVFADPQVLEQPTSAAKRLSRVLGLDIRDLKRKFRDQGKRFVWIKRRIDVRHKDEILSWRLRGIGVVEEPRRLYPSESLLGQVLGFVGDDGQGLSGVEMKFEGTLDAEPRAVSLQRDAHGRPLLLDAEAFAEAPQGEPVQLTIDAELQYYLEQELVSAVRRHSADGAVGVVLDAQTSNVLAMASVPLFNPNRGSLESALARNRTITDPIEPGSTLKTLTIAGALREGLVAPNTKIDCGGGQMKIGRRVIREADSKHKWDHLSVGDVLQHSSNVGASRIALLLGDDRLRKVLRDFGLGEKTSVELPGESRGIMPELPWRDHLVANVSFGHGVAATPLQIANAYAAIANGGILNQPSILKTEKPRSHPIRRVLTEKQSGVLKLMLMGVTAPGATGANARVMGFPVAGKTGTAQKLGPDGNYVRGYVSSFAGFLPAGDPRFVIYIAVDNPKEGYYASDVAAPVFSNVGGFAARRAGLSPSIIGASSIRPEDLVPMQKKPALSKATVTDLWLTPKLTGLGAREALALVKNRPFSVDVRGEGLVAEQYPAPGTRLSLGEKMRIILQR